MGKKARKTRWRTLAIDAENQSDSEESHTAAHVGNKHAYYSNGTYSATYGGGGGGSNGHYQNGYQSHFGGVHRSYRTNGGGGVPRGRFGQQHGSHYAYNNHSSRGAPPTATAGGGEATRKHDETKTTLGGGNNTVAAGTNTSDGKITFNEDEYTRITTPRQDVLFKKGYLNKPKAYQTQTSTGASTISTGNSTGNGTPDHQSADGAEGTDMEYESQFVFPNGFVDQNGIYYINSYETYPLVVYNSHMYYPEYVPSTRSKRLSTGSLTESTSPHNEETSQELSHSGGETVNYPEYGNLYNVVYPGYFYNNGVPQEMELSHGEPRKIKKRRRRKLSKPVPEGNWTTSSSDDYDESEEMVSVSEIENRIIQGTHRPPAPDSPEEHADTNKNTKDKSEECKETDELPECVSEEPTMKTGEPSTTEGETDVFSTSPDEVKSEDKPEVAESSKGEKKALKADAKEFVPRFFHHRHHPPPQHHPQFLIPLPPSFLHHQHHAHQSIHILPAPQAQSPTVIPATIPPMVQACPPTMGTPESQVPEVEAINGSEQTGEVSNGGTPANEIASTSVVVIPSPGPRSPASSKGHGSPRGTCSPKGPSIAPMLPEVQKTAEMPTTPIMIKPVNSPRPMVGVPLVTTSPLKHPKQQIDIAKFVSKLEAAAKEQRRPPRTRRNYTRPLPVDLTLEKRVPSGSAPMALKVDTKTASTSTTFPTGKNYAQMLSKKSTATSPMKRFTKSNRSPSKPQHQREVNPSSPSLQSQPEPPKIQITGGVSQQPRVQLSSQWISVQSRKKRKNKNHEDVEHDWEEEVKPVTVTTDDGFELYDVSKLEDVIVIHVQEGSRNIPEALQRISGVSHSVDVSQDVREARDGFDVVVTKDNNLVPVHVGESRIPEVHSLAQQKAAEEEEFDKLIRTLEELEAKTPAKKRLNKTPSKRVMITDIQVEEVLPLTITEVQDEPLKVKKTKKKMTKEKEPREKEAKERETKDKEPKEREPKEKECKVDLKEPCGDLKETLDSRDLKEFAQDPKDLEEVSKLVVNDEPTSDLTDSPRSETLTLEVKASTSEETCLPEDETLISEESPERKRKKKKKTSKKGQVETPSSIPTTPSTCPSSDEPSYNFLLTDSLLEEERTNLEVSEELDKIIQRGMFTSLEEKIKSLNITAVSSDDTFFKSMTFDGPSQKVKEDNLTTLLAKTTNIFNKRPMCQHHQDLENPSSTSTGSFLDLASLHEDPGIDHQHHRRRLDVDYPITNAVRDWMVRTRETTPDVELLKSPRTILKDLRIAKSPEESQGNSIKESWSLTPESSFEDEDLLECWDDLEDTTRIAGLTPTPTEGKTVEEEKQKQIEASLEVYESLYGKNEDFNQLKAEIEERKRNGTLPKHGGLPYRAVCCSLQ